MRPLALAARVIVITVSRALRQDPAAAKATLSKVEAPSGGVDWPCYLEIGCTHPCDADMAAIIRCLNACGGEYTYVGITPIPAVNYSGKRFLSSGSVSGTESCFSTGTYLPHMIRFVHSADWQLGARFSQFGPKADQLRMARIATLKNALALHAGAFLIAGDLSDDNQMDNGRGTQVEGLAFG